MIKGIEKPVNINRIKYCKNTTMSNTVNKRT